MQTAAVALSPRSPGQRTLVLIGQPSAAELAELARSGIATVLDLRQAGEERGFDEPAAAAAAGLRYVALPVAGAAGLTRGNVEAFARIVDDPAHHPLAVHCATANRVGALVALKAAWLDGAAVEDALALGRQAGLVAMEGAVRPLLATAG